MRVIFLSPAVFLVFLPTTGSLGGEVRRWTDSSGIHAIDAQLIDVTDGTVRLRKADDGTVVTIPFARLSQADQQFVMRADNPFAHPKPAEPAPKMDKKAGDESRLAILQRIYEQRVLLLLQLEPAKGRMHAIESEYNNAIGAQRTINAQIATVRQQQPFPFAPGAAAAAQISDLQSNLQQWQTRIDVLEPQIRQQQAEIKRLYAEADQLREQWLKSTDLFGKLRRGEHEAAIGVLTEWTVLHASDPFPFIARGFAYLNTGQYELAAADFLRASQLEDPNMTPFALAAHGYACSKLGNNKKAMAELGSVLRLNRALGVAYIFRGRINAEEGRHSAALADYTTATRLLPNSPDAFESLAFLLATCAKDSIRNGKKALQHAETANELSGGDDWKCLRTIAAAYAETGDYPSALKCVDKAIDLADEKGGLELRAERALYRLGRPFRVK